MNPNPSARALEMEYRQAGPESLRRSGRVPCLGFGKTSGANSESWYRSENGLYISTHQHIYIYIIYIYIYTYK